MQETNNVGPAVAGDEMGQFLMADCEFIGPSPWNRERFDPEEQKKLEESVRERGVLQAIRLRPNPKYRVEVDCKFWNVVTQTEGTVAVAGIESAEEAEGVCARLNAPLFEIIMGERRWRASVAMGLAQIPSMVRVVSDRQAIEEQKVENLQREGLNAIDEATGYQQLVDVYKREGAGAKEAVKMVSERVGVSVSVVYERMKLLSLPDSVKQATLSGRLPASHASLIAKLDDATAQEDVLGAILKPSYGDRAEFHDDDASGERPDPSSAGLMAFRKAKALISQKEEELKFAAAYFKIKAEYEAKGFKVLTLAECKKVFPYSWSGSPNGKKYVAPDAWCYATTSPTETWDRFLGSKAPAPVYAINGKGEVSKLYRTAEAVKGLEAAGHTLREENVKEVLSKEDQAAAFAKAKAEGEEREAIFLQTMGEVCEAAKASEGPGFWKFLFEILVGDGGVIGEYQELVFKRRGVKMADDDGYVNNEEVYEKFSKLNGKELKGLIAEILFAQLAPYNFIHTKEWPESMGSALKALGMKLPPTKLQTSGPEEKAQKKMSAKKPKKGVKTEPAEAGASEEGQI